MKIKNKVTIYIELGIFSKIKTNFQDVTFPSLFPLGFSSSCQASSNATANTLPGSIESVI